MTSYMNQKVKSNNHSGYTGIHWDKRNKRWIATIRYVGIRKYIGSFRDINDAITVRAAIAEACTIMKSLNVASVTLQRTNTINVIGIIPQSESIISIQCGL